MTKAQLIKAICKRESKKVSVSVGNVREILAIIEDLCAEHCVEHGFTDQTVSIYGLELIDFALEDSIKKKFNKLMARKRKKKVSA